MRQVRDDGVDRRGFEWHLLDALTRPPKPTVLAGHKGSVNEVAVFPDRRRIASVGDDGTLRIWDIATKIAKTVRLSDVPLHSVAVSPDGHYVAAGSGHVAPEKSRLYLCDLEDLNEKTRAREIFQGESTIESLVFIPDGSRIVAGLRYERVDDIHLNGEVERSIPCASRVESLEFYDGNQLLVPNRRESGTGIVQLWHGAIMQREYSADYASVAISKRSPDARNIYIAAVDSYRSKTVLFDGRSGQVVAEAPIGRDFINSLAYSPDGHTLAIGCNNGVVECFRIEHDTKGNAVALRRRKAINAHAGAVRSLAYLSADVLVTAGEDGLVNLWDVASEREQSFELNESGLVDLEFSPDGAFLACLCNACYFLADSRTGAIFGGRALCNNASKVAWSPSGERFAVCCRRLEKIAVYRPDGQKVYQISHDGMPADVAYSPDGERLAIISAKQLQVCNEEDGWQLYEQELAGGFELAVAFSQDGKFLAYGAGAAEVSICDAGNYKVVRKLPCGSETSSIAFGRNGGILATGHADGKIRLWETNAGELQAELAGHGRVVRDVVFSPDGSTLLSASMDGTVRAWNVETGRCYGVVHRIHDAGSEAADDVMCRVSLSSDGRRLAIGRDVAVQRKVLVWDLDVPEAE
jgi:WD40 repeat protein